MADIAPQNSYMGQNPKPKAATPPRPRATRPRGVPTIAGVGKGTGKNGISPMTIAAMLKTAAGATIGGGAKVK